MFRPVLDAVGGSLFLTAIVAMLPLLTIFILLGWLRLAAWKAGIAALVVSLIVAIWAYSMPVGMAVSSGNASFVQTVFDQVTVTNQLIE